MLKAKLLLQLLKFRLFKRLPLSSQQQLQHLPVFQLLLLLRLMPANKLMLIKKLQKIWKLIQLKVNNFLNTIWFNRCNKSNNKWWLNNQPSNNKWFQISINSSTLEVLNRWHRCHLKICSWDIHNSTQCNKCFKCSLCNKCKICQHHQGLWQLLLDQWRQGLMILL